MMNQSDEKKSYQWNVAVERIIRKINIMEQQHPAKIVKENK